MTKLVLNISLIVVLHNINYSQDQNSIPSDSLGFKYNKYKIETVMWDCNWHNDTEFNTEAKNIYCLNIANKNKLAYFLNNIDDFKHIKALSIYKVRIKDFDFLNKLPNLQYISVGVLDNKNIASFVESVNCNKKIDILDVSQLKMRKFPKELNQLRYIKSMEIRNSKALKYIEMDLSLKQLSVVNNKKIKQVYTQNVNYISFSFNNLKKIPKGLDKSNNLHGIEFTAEYKLWVDCPLNGFNSLEEFNIFGSSAFIDKDCFVENNKVFIFQRYQSNGAN